MAFSYRRLRHTYGFGVHSPYAFRMVRDVVRPGRQYAWYGYEDIDAAVNSARASAKMERMVKMFHRLIAFLHPASLFLPLGIDPLFYTAASCVGSGMKIERKPKLAEKCVMVATHDDFLPLEQLKKHLLTDGNALAILNYPEGWDHELFRTLPHGLMLYGTHNLIIVNRHDMMKVAYSVRI
ncbi:MAG: hypothetical protein HDS62_08930 [Bacteroidales bacterium]|nr:hypothetical protein [Bacteroidales bacterium]